MTHEEKIKALPLDEGGLRYARRHGVKYVYADIDSGEFMQFCTTGSWVGCDDRWRGMFPHRRMLTVSVNDYITIKSDEIEQQKQKIHAEDELQNQD